MSIIERNNRPISTALTGQRVVEVRLLGGFSVLRHGSTVPESTWQHRRSAKYLVKLLSLSPGYALHRGPIIELLWPDGDPASGLRNFAKALHVARRVLEPDLVARGQSSYLQLEGDVLTLVPPLVRVDVTVFRSYAEAALRSKSIADCEAAILAYGGELLPEDRYLDWVMDHRQALADLLIDVYLLAAEALEASGMLMEALQRLRLAERMDPLREDVNHALVRLYALAGKKHEALRHFHVYQERLKREWDVAPGAEMEALYRDIGVGRIASVALQVPNGRRVVPVFAHDASSRLVGRTRVLDILMQQYAQATTGKGGTVLISGEMGVGKVRLVSELMAYAQSKGAVILRGSAPSLASDDAPYWPIAQALEMYVTDLPDQSRADLAARYRELGWLVPTLAPVGGAAEDVPTSPPETSRLFASVARLLTDLSQHNVLVIALRDVHSADASTVKLLEYLVQLAPERKWLILGSYREEDIPSDSPFPTFLTFAARHGLGLNIELHRLAQQDNNELVRLLLGDGAVSEDLLDFVFEASLGNPFFTYQVVETLVAQGRVSLDSGVWHLDPGTPIPLSREVRELVAMRLSRFDDDVQDLLQLAALTEPAISFNLLFESAQTLGCPLSEAVLLSALDRVIEARILEECDQGYTFSHPMYRAVILDRLSRHRREQLWSALEAVRTSRTRTGHPATAPPTDTIMESVPTAALLPWEAAAKYGREVDALDSQGLVVESAAMRQKLAAALVAMGRYERAVSVLRQASTIYREVQDDEGCARIEAQLDLLNQVSDL